MYNLLEYACIINKIDIVKYLIEDMKMDPCKPDNIYNSYDLLELACIHNRIKIIKYLIKVHNLDPSKCSNYNLLKLACLKNKINIIKYLVEKIKMNPYASDINGNNIIDIAHLYNKKKVLEYFGTNKQNYYKIII